MTADQYVQTVVDQVPRGLPLRDQIAMELRSLVAERIEHGQPLDAVLQQLGDPVTLAESYLAAVPLQSAGLFARFAAKLVDVAIIVAIDLVVALILWMTLPPFLVNFLPVICIAGCVLGFVTYTVVAEYQWGRTLGKRLMGIRVVRESGARITLGQSMLRQLPFFGQFFFIDALFALFTERRQRAFELITKTRAVALLATCVLLAPSMGALAV